MDATELTVLLGRKVTAVSRFATAGVSDVALVELADGDRVVVKRAPEEWHWTTDKEAFVYRLLAERAPDVPAPEVLAVPAPGTVVLSVIEGGGTSEIETTNLYGQIGALLAQLHTVQLDAFGYVGTHGIFEPHATNGAYMRHQFEKKVREHGEFGGDVELAARIAAYVEERALLFDTCVTPSLCHNDCHEGNLIARDGRIVGIVDFQNAIGGDPLLDLAKCIYYSQRDRETIAAALAEGWGPLRDSWRDVVDLYVLYHQLELWNWFAYLGDTEKLAPLAAEMRQATRNTD